MAWFLRLPFGGAHASSRADRSQTKLQPPEGKAGTANPAVLAALGGATGAAWSGRSYAALAREGFMKNPVAHRAVRMISETAAAAPWLLYDGSSELDEHPLLDLLAQPNAQASGTEFLETLYGHLLISGNAWIEAVEGSDGLIGLNLLRPDRVRVIEGADGWPVAHEYQVGQARRRYPVDPVAGRGLLHLRLFHPLDDHAGFAPLGAAQMALDMHNQAMTWNKALLDNSARPSGALVYQPKDGGNLTEEQFDRLKAQLEEGYQGASRAGRAMLLEGGLDWKAMGLTPKDMDFTEARNGAARDIALALGVPPMLIGIPGDLTYANYQEANRAFCRHTVLPLVVRTAEAMTGWLAPVYGGKLRLTFDADQLPGLASEREQLWKRLGEADFLTPDEKREAVGYQSLGAGSGITSEDS